MVILLKVCSSECMPSGVHVRMASTLVHFVVLLLSCLQRDGPLAAGFMLEVDWLYVCPIC